MRRSFVSLGIVLLLFTAIWILVLSSTFTERFTEDWTWDVNILGTTAFADEETGAFPDTPMDDDPITITERSMSVTKIDGDTAEIDDEYRQTDPATNTVLWELTYSISVDRETVKHAEEAYQDDYFLFPENTEKKTYNYRNSTYQGVPMKFEKEEEVSDITTYKFIYHEDLDNTLAYDYIELEEGQKVVCFDFEADFWVEPRTGEVLKYREYCPGDYVVDANGEKLYGLQRWSGETTGDDLIRRADVIKDRINDLKLYGLYIPLASGVLGLIVLAFGIAPLLLKKSENA